MSEGTTELPKAEQQQNPHKVESSPARFTRTMRALIETTTGRPRVEGLQNLEKIPEGRGVIFAATHLTDIDIPIAAYALGKRFDIVIADMSVHQGVSADPTFIGIGIAGKDRFEDIRYTKGDRRGVFRPEDYSDMKAVLDRGQRILIAAHNPVYPEKGHEWALPDKPGIGAIYLAQLAQDAVIVPVALDIHSDKPVGSGSPLKIHNNVVHRVKTLFGKGGVTMRIGEPMSFEKLNTSPMSESSEVHSLKELVSEEKAHEMQNNRADKRELLHKLREQSAQIMLSLAAMLPPEKRGKWGEQPQQTPIAAPSQQSSYS